MSAPKRAAPLSPDARRASIIEATLPLLRTYGATVTTSQIALAAGVAEGTLFRVFPDKDSLIAAAIETAFDPEPVERELGQIDRQQELRPKLVAAVEVVQRRIERVWQLMSVLGRFAIPQVDARRTKGMRAGVQHDQGIFRQLEALFAGHADELRCAPDYAARVLRMMAFAGTHPRFNDEHPLTAAEIVAVVLDGIGTRPDLDEEL